MTLYQPRQLVWVPALREYAKVKEIRQSDGMTQYHLCFETRDSAWFDESELSGDINELQPAR